MAKYHIVKVVVFIALSIAVFVITYQIGKVRQPINKEAACKLTQATVSPELKTTLIPRGTESSCCIPFRQPHVHKLDYAKSESKGVLKEVFSTIHHPDGPTETELLFTDNEVIDMNDPYKDCSTIYLTRTGSLLKMPATKCVAVVKVQEGGSSPHFNSHRYGTMSNLTDQYQRDYLDQQSFAAEVFLLNLLLKDLDNVVKLFIQKMGDPLLPNGDRRSVIIIVANEGVIDVLLNFLCSCRQAGISVDNLVVFLGQPQYADLIENMGAKTFYHEALGPIPTRAAGFYGDYVFGLMMWMKATSVYVASKAGFDVIFQDVDLVWLEDPLPLLRASVIDFAFMDDGARTARFTPFFVNSGFYFQKYTKNTLYLMERMLKAMFEIANTHSHQSVLTHMITEAHDLMNLQVHFL
jgi:hypothetical protein